MLEALKIMTIGWVLLVDFGSLNHYLQRSFSPEVETDVAVCTFS